ncbi:MAG TPA: AIR synthase-related protein [Actinomycetota bacterium]|nr:AIR synthase-related protein [Actinomycetota bacterium]
MIHKFSVRPKDESASATLRHERQALGIPDLVVWREYYVETPQPLDEGDKKAVCSVLADGVATVAVADEALVPGEMVQVAHRRGIIDNESDSIVTMCELLGIEGVAGKAALTYVSRSPELQAVVEARRFNSNIEELHTVEPFYETLLPRGTHEPPERYDLSALDDEALAAVGTAGGRNLDPRQMRQIRAIQTELGEDAVTDVLIEALDARWSDHCSHTTWKSRGDLLKRLVAASEGTGNPNIVSMFHDNAGVWELFDGWGIAIKGETHNGPSAVSAYFGQLTKLGGVLRDILGTGLGADPIGCFEYTATGVPEDPPAVPGRPGARQIATDTIRAIKEYGNTFGVPMTWSKMTFHRAYRAKPFALGGSIGLVPLDKAQRGKPRSGDVVVLVGALTGNEGIHGASASSAGAQMEGAAVQIGSPLEEVKFRKCILDLRDAGCISAITDVGGAGLNSAVGEMGEACGVWLNTAAVPLKTSGLPMWRILLSESQERMLLAIPAAKLDEAAAIFRRHQVRHTSIGRFVDNDRYCVFFDESLTPARIEAMGAGEVPADVAEPGFDVPYALLVDSPEPVEVGEPPATPPPAPDAWPDLDVDGIARLLDAVVADPEVASQHAADSQYDSTVQGHTVYGPAYGTRRPVRASYWAGTPLYPSPAGVILSTAFNPWLFELDPVRALRQSFLAAVGTQVLAGVELADVCLCDNFYTPDLAEHADEWLVAMVDELASLVGLFGTPVISGKDSSAGSTKTPDGIVSVPPAVFLTALGKIDDVARLVREQWQRPGNLLVRVGPSSPSPAATVAGRVLDLAPCGLDDADATAYSRYLQSLREARRSFVSATTIGPGGVAAGAVVGALASGLGIDLSGDCTTAGALFAEHRTGALVEIDERDLGGLPQELEARVVGRLTDVFGVRLGDRELLTAEVESSWRNGFARRIA